MNPNDAHNEALNLPTPVGPEVSPQSTPSHESGSGAPEVAHSPALPTPPPPAQTAIDPLSAGQSVNPSTQQVSPATAMTSTDDLDADDADLIEKEWVAKAKTIIEQTKDDPHTQTKQMNRVKADYIKKRYNKDIKVNE